MSLNETEQLKRLIESSKYILLITNANKNTDAVCGALALKQFLEKQQKQADIISDSFSAPGNLRFLKGAGEIKPGVSHLQKFVIKVDISNIKMDALSYDIKDNWLSIYLTPKQGIISKNEIRTAQTNFKYDLIISINAQDLESLGDVFFNNTDLFYKVPIVNFDNHPANEHFGQLNFVELSAASVSEIIFKTINQISEKMIDKDMATALLAGMISQTKSFKTPNVTPATLNIAGQLMNMGADRETVVKHLFKSKSIASLKLWGQALAHMEHDNEFGLVWTAITREDFARSGAAESDLKDLIEELISNSPEAKLILILNEDIEQNNLVRGLLFADKLYDAKLLLQTFNPQGNKKIASFKISGKSLKETEIEVLENLKRILKENKNRQ